MLGYKIIGLSIGVSLIVILSILSGNYITLNFPTFAIAAVSEQQFTAKLFGDMEIPPIETDTTGLEAI